MDYETGIIIDKSKEVKAEWFDISDKEFVDVLKQHFKGGHGDKLVDGQEFSTKTQNAFNRPLEKSSQIYIYYASEPIRSISLLGKKLLVSDIPKGSATFDDHFEKITTDHTQMNKLASPEIKKPVQTAPGQCQPARAFSVTVDPDDIKIGIDAVLQSRLSLLLVQDSECTKNQLDFGVLAREVSISLTSIILSN